MATATKKTAEPKVEAKAEEVKSTVENIRENVTERATAVRDNVTERYEDAREVASKTSGAAMDFGKAYYAGVTTVGKTLFGFGKEIYGEVASHAQKTMSAKSILSLIHI